MISLKFQDQDIKVCNIYLVKENKERFDSIYITHTAETKEVINVEFIRTKGDKPETVSNWEVIEENHSVDIDSSYGLLNIVWKGQYNRLMLGCHVPLSQVELVKTNREL